MSEPIRITEVLNYFKEPWYIDWVHRLGRTEANKIAKAAMKVGTRVDEIIKKECVESSHIPTQYKKESQEVQNCLVAYRKWADVYKPKSITPCTRLYATIEGVEVTGEPDIMVDHVLVDIKCSSKISPTYWIQNNTYKFLSFLQRNMTEDQLSQSKVGILRLDKKTGSYEYIIHNYQPNLVTVWCGMLRAYLYLKENDNDGDEL